MKYRCEFRNLADKADDAKIWLPIEQLSSGEHQYWSSSSATVWTHWARGHPEAASCSKSAVALDLTDMDMKSVRPTDQFYTVCQRQVGYTVEHSTTEPSIVVTSQQSHQRTTAVTSEQSHQRTTAAVIAGESTHASGAPSASVSTQHRLSMTSEQLPTSRTTKTSTTMNDVQPTTQLPTSVSNYKPTSVTPEQRTSASYKQLTTAATEQTASVSTKQSTSVTTEQTTSATTEQTASTTTEHTASVTTEQTSSVTTEQTASATTEQTTSVTTEQTASVTTEQTASVTTEQQVLTTTEEPTAMSTEQPTHSAGELPTLMPTEAPTPIATESPASLVTWWTAVPDESSTSSNTELQPTPVTDSQSTFRTDSQSTLRADSLSTPRTDSQSTLRTDSQSTPRTDSQSTPRTGSQSTPMLDEPLTVNTEVVTLLSSHQPPAMTTIDASAAVSYRQLSSLVTHHSETNTDITQSQLLTRMISTYSSLASLDTAEIISQSGTDADLATEAISSNFKTITASSQGDFSALPSRDPSSAYTQTISDRVTSSGAAFYSTDGNGLTSVESNDNNRNTDATVTSTVTTVTSKPSSALTSQTLSYHEVTTGLLQRGISTTPSYNTLDPIKIHIPIGT